MSTRKVPMSKKFYMRAVAVLALCVGMAAVFAGCFPVTDAIDDPQKDNRNYMAQINSSLNDFGTELEAFNEAVSNDDVVGMKSQADKAFKVIDEIEKIEAPEALKDIHSDYKKAFSKLKEALSDYIDFYTEVKAFAENTPEEEDSSQVPDFEKKLKDLQEKYNEGMDLLEAADKKATEME